MRSLVAFSFVFACLSLSAPAFAQDVRHTVVKGDSLWSIAQRYHVSVAVLESRNHLTDSSILALGQELTVTGAAGVAKHVNRARPSASVAAHAQPVARHARSGRRSALTASRRPAAVQPASVRYAMWEATHSGEAAVPSSVLGVDLSERILAFDARVTRTALRYVGVPYVWGGTSFSGVDCSGFVQAVFEHNGIELPRTADSQFEVGRPVKMADLQPGDLVFFETYASGASHVGIYLGGGRFIHASSSDGVRVDALAMDYYASRYLGARRLIR